jgi:alkanesulfonate monooxygenase SsuD/methylene tetrahydromethanopterin reductase-like flavin-dependent oxidoreductase (luciferase family)
MMVLGFTGGALGGHLGGWRHPDSFPTTAMQLQCMVEMAQIAERGKLDMMFLADGKACARWTSPLCSRPTARPTARRCSSR